MPAESNLAGGRFAFEQCPHRRALGPDLAGDALCLLLQQLLGTGDPEFCQVSADACRACCNSEPTPTLDDLNPVVASLLYGLTDRLLGQPSAGGCDEAKLAHLHEWAERSLPVMLPDEDESAPSVGSSTRDLSKITTGELAAIVPLPGVGSAGPEERDATHWAVAITTAPRRQSTLRECLSSLKQSGWEAPILFADGAVPIPVEHEDSRLVSREPAVGARNNYYLTIRDLLELEPRADTLMVVQDDVLFPGCVALRSYVEQVLRGCPKPALISLYCCADDTADEPGWSDLDGCWRYGALAFVYTRHLAEAFIADKGIRAFAADTNGNGGIDSAIGVWAEQSGIPVYRPTPSLVQHIGHVSAIWATSRAVGLRRASDYIGDYW